MKPINLTRERGVALLGMLAVIMLVASWFLVSKLNAESSTMTAVSRARNAEVLNRAKQALIGYVAMQAANSGEDNPGALPCPEAAGYFDNAGQEGQTASSCTLPKVGRFPWRSIGTEKLLDSAGEPLWYVVSAGWARTSGNTNINSNTLGQLSVDGIANAAVALIIAPGPAFNVPACGAIPAKAQRRPTVNPLDGDPFPNLRNYLECENATAPTPDAMFVTSGPSGSFNDQVAIVTVADIMPSIEAAIAKRIERDIAPQLKSMYASSTWGLSSSNPLFPYPAQFDNPNPGTSSFQGASAMTGGLLPVTSSSCTGDPRCSTTFVAWNTGISPTVTQTGGTGALTVGSTCSFITVNQARCTGSYAASGATQLTMTVRASNVAMALRTLDASQISAQYQDTSWTSVTPSVTGSFVNDGSAYISATATFPDPPTGNHNFQIIMNIDVLADHPVIKSMDATYGWFVRNEWHKLLYYAPAPGNTAAPLPALPSCTTSSNCLSVINVTPAGAQRAILILAGRSANGTARPSPTLSDYLEFGNATGAYERRTINASNTAAPARRFNDRIVVVDSN